MKKKISRRKVLKMFGASIVAVLAACSPFRNTSTTDRQLPSSTATQAPTNTAALTDEPIATRELTETPTEMPQAETPSPATTGQNLATVFID